MTKSWIIRELLSFDSALDFAEGFDENSAEAGAI